ncbi:MAG: DUF4301 family protein [Bacteroidales bacterium]|jgi:hypothetical protein
MLTDQDKYQIREKGISEEQINWQLSVFKKGIDPVKLDRPASVGDGILRPDEKAVRQYLAVFEEANDVRKIKFVPASGAASRMFKALFEFMDEAGGDGQDPGDEFIRTFFSNIRKFAFCDNLEEIIGSQGGSLETMLQKKQYREILTYLLTGKGLNYGNLPKGLLQFHKYGSESKTPFEEHIAEAVEYTKSRNGEVSVHFTVSPEHRQEFMTLLNAVKQEYEDKYNIRLDISFSVQKPSTDTMAVDRQNDPFREPDGSILFRPGGHGALIGNLQDLDADLIFIKNIDNVVPEKFREPTIRYKKILAGVLLKARDRVFEFLRELDDNPPGRERLKEMYEYITNDLHYIPAQQIDLSDTEAARQRFKSILDRPLRVCGVVKNLGEPGGGPFWAPNSRGDLTLQIVESSQVDQGDAKQVETFGNSTHFNPVDLVCATKNYREEKFYLADYIDSNTCFISEKSKDGRDLKALELPGLWNGAMADWLTLMVEVPVETFNPVKTVNDLLRKEHQ